MRAVTKKTKQVRVLKDRRTDPTKDAFQKYLDDQKDEEAIVELLKEHSVIFKSNLPPGLPPKRNVDHRIDIEEGCKPPLRMLYQLSPAELVAAK